MSEMLRTFIVATIVSLMIIVSAGLVQAGPSPSITDVTPSQVPSYGGFSVAITGDRFQPGATVTFGGTPAAETTFVSSAQIHAVTPLAPKGIVNVTVTNPDGKAAAWGGFEFFYSGTGIFEKDGPVIPAAAETSHDIEFADVDGDGDLDAYVGEAGQDQLYLNNGDAGFFDVTATHLPLTSGYSFDVEFGDFDSDGDADVILAITSPSIPNTLLLNDGNGYFSDVSATHLPALPDPSTAVEVGDIDSDGDLDLVFSNTDGTKRFLSNAGNGTYSDVTAPEFRVPNPVDHQAALGDVDGDGDLDLATACYGQNSLYLNDGLGNFTDATESNFPNVSSQSFDVEFGDLDADGDLDIVVGNYYTNSVWINAGNGVFSDESSVRLPLDSTRRSLSVDIEDANGDGHLDLLFGQSYGAGQQNLLYLNDGTGVFYDDTTARLPALIDDTYDAKFGDADGDGDADIMTASHNLQQNRLHINDGGGFYSEARAGRPLFPLDTDTSMDIDAADVDGDGDLDVAVANWGTYGTQNSLYINEGGGLFTDVSSTNLPLFNDTTADVEFGDVDGDGDQDIVFSNKGQNRLYLNDGAGLFTDVTAAQMPVDSVTSRDTDFGDLDGDGDLDLVIANYNTFGAQNSLYINDGMGFFTDVSSSTLPTVIDSSENADLGDVDGDGDLDIVIGNWSGNQNRLYLNDGSGVFSDATATNMPVDQYYTFDIELGDVDGDGDLDIVSAEFNTTQNRLYLNDGSGHFSDATSALMPIDGDHSLEIDLGDTDGDGDLDMLITNHYSQNVLYQNAGDGTFTDVTATAMPFDDRSSYDADFADVDGDGDLDIISANTDGQNTVYLNYSIVDEEVPSVPTNLVATAAACDQVDLTWSASTDNVGVAGYTIYRDGLVVDTSSSTAYSDSGLMENILYTYTVDAYDAAGNTSAQSSPASDTTPPCGTLTCSSYTEKGLCNDDPDCEWQGSPRNGVCVASSSGVCTDGDGDGWGDPGDASCPNGNERDCDDTNFDANPGAMEGPEGDPTCFDGFDNDCDSLVDILDPACQPPVDCGQYSNKNSCNDVPACMWDNKNKVCVTQ